MKGFKSTSTNPYTYTQDGVWKKGQYTFQAVVLSDSGYAFAFQRADTTWQTIDLSWQVKEGSYSKIQWTFTLEVDAVAFRLIANTVTGETTVLQPMLEKGSNGSTPIAHEEDLRGMDGDNHEFIFTRNTTGIAPDTPLSTQKDDYVPEDWTDNAQGVTSEIPFEFVSMRERKNGVWLDFSPPSLWAKWGEDGLSVNLLVEGHYKSHWEGITKVVEIVGGVDVGGNEVVKVSAVFRKGEENIAATVSQSRGFQWYVNGVHLTSFDNQPFITLDETYGDGFADYVVLSYLVNSIREEERREIINISEGMDGIGEEFIFKANNSDTVPPVLPQTTDVGYQNDDYHGDWSDDPVAPTELNQFVWVAKRKKIGGIWEAFGAPSVWTKWVTDGEHGKDAVAPIIIDGFWAFWDDALQDYVKSTFSAIGDDGHSPYVGANGNWYQWVSESGTYEDTGIKAEGEDGEPGKDAVAPIIIDGFWAFWDDALQDYVKSTFSAIGDDGHSPYVGANGNWYQWVSESGVYGDTGIKAEGEDAKMIEIRGNTTLKNPDKPGGIASTELTVVKHGFDNTVMWKFLYGSTWQNTPWTDNITINYNEQASLFTNGVLQLKCYSALDPTIFTTVTLSAVWDGDDGDGNVHIYRHSLLKPATPASGVANPTGWTKNPDKGIAISIPTNWTLKDKWYQSEELTTLGATTISVINFTTTLPNQVVVLELRADGHATYDYIYAGNLNIGVTTSNYYDRVISGKKVISYDVPNAGNHSIQIMWRKGIATIVGSNRGYFAIINNVKVWRSTTAIINKIYQSWSSPEEFYPDSSTEETIYCLSKTETPPLISDSEAYIDEYLPLPCALTSYRGDFSTSRAYAIGQVVVYSGEYYKVIKAVPSNYPGNPTNTEYFENIKGWTDNAKGATNVFPFEYRSKRKKSGGAWGAFSPSTVDSRWVEDAVAPIIIDGFWAFWDDTLQDYEKSSFSAVGDDGHSPFYNISTGTWWEWIPHQGQYGDTGIKAEGKDGEDGSSAIIDHIFYLATSASSGVTVYTDGWKQDPSQTPLTPTNKYLWSYTSYVYTNGGGYYNTIPAIIGVYGDKGAPGPSPYIDPTTGTWWTWNDANGQYEDTGYSPVGSDGRIPYPAGYYDDNKWYRREAEYAPYVQYEGALYLLIKDTPNDGIPTSNSEYWKAFNHWQAVFVDSLVAAFAKIGGAVFTGDTTETSSGIRGRLISETGVKSGSDNINYSEYVGDSGAWIPKMMLDFLTGAAYFGAKKIMFNPDGSGYLANQKVSWNANGDTNYQGTLTGVSGSFKMLNCVNEYGNTVGTIKFGTDGRIWFENCSIAHQAATGPFLGSDVWVRGAFGSFEKTAIRILGSYGYIYARGLGGSSEYLTFIAKTDTGGNTYYDIPLYSPTTQSSGCPIDIVIINHSSSSAMNYNLQYIPGKTVVVVNSNDANSNVYVYCNGIRKQLMGGEAATFVCVGSFQKPDNSSIVGRGWFMSGKVDNNWT